jgi:hypothetical protein
VTIVIGAHVEEVAGAGEGGFACGIMRAKVKEERRAFRVLTGPGGI